MPEDSNHATNLVKTRLGWYAIFPERVEHTTTEKDAVIALDPGVRTFLTGFDGERITEFGKGDIGRIFRLCLHLDKLLSRSTKVKAKKRRRMRQAADLLRARIRNLVDEMHRQVACYLTTNYKLIYLPTFETSEMTIRGRRKLNRKSVRQMLGWAHYRFKQVLKSQAMRRGVLVVDTNEAFTSKTCTKCGHLHRNLGGAKVFKCPKCGYQVDRDWGGARNNLLRALGDSPLSLSNEREAIVVNFLSLQQFTA